MKFGSLFARAAQLRPQVVLSGAAALTFGLSIVFSAHQSAAQVVPVAAAQRSITILNDLGGDVGARANKIAAMRKEGQSVEIRGASCYSSCTMYLSLPHSCISRNTEFGFHRPSLYGAALAPDKFEFWSRVIAAHYPPPLQSWYMSDARYSESLRMISGAEIIRLGVPECT